MLDLEEYNTRLNKSMRMTRRELRGDEAVKGDPLADLPQFVRDLDVVNYRSLMREDCVPSSEDIYDSKQGHFRYSRSFLDAARKGSDGVRWSTQFFDYILQNKPTPLQRTNKIKDDEWRMLLRWPLVKDHIASFINDQHWTDESGDINTYLSDTLQNNLGPFDHTRYKAFINLKTRILELLLTEQLRLETTRGLMEINHGFTASRNEYILILIVWSLCPPETLPRHSLERILNEGRQDAEAQEQALEMARMQMDIDDDEHFDIQDYRSHLPDKDDGGSSLNHNEPLYNDARASNIETDDRSWHKETSLVDPFEEPPCSDEVVGKGKGKAIDREEAHSKPAQAQTSPLEPALTIADATPPDEPPSYENVWTGASNDTMLEITPVSPLEDAELAPPKIEALDRTSLGITSGGTPSNAISIGSSTAAGSDRVSQIRPW